MPYSDTDNLTADTVRRATNQSLSKLNKFLQNSDTQQDYRLPVLKWSLLDLGLVYFFTGFAKVKSGVFEWATAENLGRPILWKSGPRINRTTAVADFLLNNPILLSVAAWLTVILEIGLLITILVGLPLTPFAIGLLSMHTIIALTMQIFFFDQYLFFALFLPWNRLYSRLVRSNEFNIIYYDNCYFCARSLYVFKQFDVDSTITFYTPETAPQEYLQRSGVDPELAMYAVAVGQTYEGYHAFRRLLAQFRIFAPVVAIMKIPPVVNIGKLVYERIAANRSRYFVCDIDEEN